MTEVELNTIKLRLALLEDKVETLVGIIERSGLMLRGLEVAYGTGFGLSVDGAETGDLQQKDPDRPVPGV